MVLSPRAGGLTAAHELVEPVAMWWLNVGVVVYVVLYVGMDTAHRAGGLVAVLAMIFSLYRVEDRQTTRASGS